MERRILLSSLLLLALLTSACAERARVGSPGPSLSPSPSPSGGTVSLTADATSYSSGAIVRLTLRAGQSTTVGYNLCPAYLELDRQVGSDWRKVDADLGPSGNTVCTAELRLLQPGQTAPGEAHLPQTLASGTYRIAHGVEVDNERQRVTTDAFTVTR